MSDDDALVGEVHAKVGDEHVTEEGTVRYFEGSPAGAEEFSDASLRVITDNSATIVQFDYEEAVKLLRLIQDAGDPPKPTDDASIEIVESEVPDDE